MPLSAIAAGEELLPLPSQLMPAPVLFSQTPARENWMVSKVYSMADRQIIHYGRSDQEPMRKRNVRAAATRICR